jgi:hypothetical protein
MDNDYILIFTPMPDNMTGLIEKLKKGAVDRCRERVIEARENPKKKIDSSEDCDKNQSLTSRSKKMRGL